MAENKNIKLVSNAPLYKDVRALLNNILDVTPDFPRAYKCTIGGERQWIKGIGRHALIIELMDAIGKQSTAWKNSMPVGSE